MSDSLESSASGVQAANHHMQKFEGIKRMYLFMQRWHHPSNGKAWSRKEFMAKTAVTATDHGCQNSLMELQAMGQVVLIELNLFEGQLSDWKFPTPWAKYEMHTGIMPHTQKELSALVDELQQLIER